MLAGQPDFSNTFYTGTGFSSIVLLLLVFFPPTETIYETLDLKMDDWSQMQIKL